MLIAIGQMVGRSYKLIIKGVRFDSDISNYKLESSQSQLSVYKLESAVSHIQRMIHAN